MGEVFEAEDTLLRRPVALKRVAPAVRNDPEYRRRLLREARRASSLNHPRIAQVYDIVEDRDETFLVMEYVAGASLRSRLKQPCSLSDAIRITAQCAEGLEEAHRQNIIHGDIKPENIQLTPPGDVKILDFGIARRLPAAVGAAETIETTVAGLEGTLAYMAPEVLREKMADGRADIFSLGSTLYEMLSGKNPFQADTLAETIDRVLNVEPEPLRPGGTTMPDKVRAMLRKMLAKDPAQRYASATELREDLQEFSVARQVRTGQRPIFLGAASLVATGLLVTILLLARGGNGLRGVYDRLIGPHVPDTKQLAVLPVSVDSHDSEAAAFATGLIDTLTGRLGQLTEQRSLDVIPASEVAAKGVTNVDQARQQFGINVVLAVNIHRSGRMLRISPVLLDARTHRELRASMVTDSMENPFALEDKIADVVVEELGLELKANEGKALQVHGTRNAEAYDFYLQGVGYLREIEKAENVDNAITLFQRALEKDNGFGLAYAGLGEAQWAKYEQVRDTKWIAQAAGLCKRAVDAGNSEAEGYVCLGKLSNGQGKYEQGATYYEKAIEIDKSSETAYAGLAGSYEGLSRFPEAEQTLQRLLEIPGSVRAGCNALGVLYVRQGRNLEAAAMFKRYVSLAPDAFVGYYNLGATYVNLGRYSEAVEELNHSISIRPTAEAYSNRGTAYFNLGHYDLATEDFEQSVKLDSKRYDFWGNLGDGYYWTPGSRDKSPQAYRTAIGLAEDSLKVNPGDADATLYLAQYHAMLGERRPALDSLQRAQKLTPQSSDVKFNAAIIFAQLGDSDKALSALQQALAAGYPLYQIEITPNFAKLRSDPRFLEMKRKYESKERKS